MNKTPSFLETLLGPSWRTSLWGFNCMAFAYLTANPQFIGELLPAHAAAGVTSALAAISGFIAFKNSKDKQVSGNGADGKPVQVAQPDGTQKTIAGVIASCIVGAASLLYLTGCAGATAPTQAQVLATAADIVNTAGADYTAYAAAQSGTLTPAETSAALTAASNDMYGAAALASAYSGTATPIAAKLQTGAKNVATAAKIINALPSTTITSATVGNLTQAAATLAQQANGAPGPRGERGKSLPVVWLRWPSPLGFPTPEICFSTK